MHPDITPIRRLTSHGQLSPRHIRARDGARRARHRGMAAGDKLFGAFALLIGFVAFSLPLLFHDTKHLWREKRAEDVSHQGN